MNVIATIPDKWNLIYDGFVITSRERLTLDTLININPEYIFFPHWSWKIPKEIYDRFNCVIFHMTDLPFGRGGTPLQNLISRGIYETKITALRATAVIDGGPVYLKRPLSLYGTAEEIYTRCALEIKDMISFIEKNKPIPVEQTGTPVVFKRRTVEDSKMPFEFGKVFDHIRMLDAEGYPKAFIRYGDYKIEFSRASLKGGILADASISRCSPSRR
jgi:methionyl-tRNA formyltransferase